MIECLAYSTYEIEEKQPSQYVESLFIRKAIGFNCPRCEKINESLTHGQSVKCACGLFLELHGNRLAIADYNFTNNRKL